jgi:hypothetical protein
MKSEERAAGCSLVVTCQRQKPRTNYQKLATGTEQQICFSGLIPAHYFLA